MSRGTAQDQLVSHLADAHSVEERRAAAKMVAASWDRTMRLEMPPRA